MVGQDWEIARKIFVIPVKGGSIPLLPHRAGILTEDLPRRAVPLL